MGWDYKYLILDGDSKDIGLVKEDKENYWYSDLHSTGVQCLFNDAYRQVNYQILNEGLGEGVLGPLDEQLTKLKGYLDNLDTLVKEKEFLPEIKEDLEEIIQAIEKAECSFENKLLFRIGY